jgi:4-amino-4-deoxy-L-arabinose transferase-like glycosyltransferase
LYAVVAIVLAFFAFVMSSVVSQQVFERMPHLEDEVAYQYQAEIFARGQWVMTCNEPSRAFWRPFVKEYEHSGTKTCFSKYTPGWSVALGLGEAVQQGWIINAFFALLTVALIYRTGTEIFNRDVGIIAAALVAFSPAFLMLNGTLMAHSAALFYTSVFTYAVWRIEKGHKPYFWAILAGVALGWMLVTRPASTVAVAIPFIAYIGLRLLKQLSDSDTWRGGFISVLKSAQPFVVLSIITIALGSITYIYNYQATGNPRENLYTLVWSYDKVGFGECCGRSGHTLEKAVRQTRWDMSLAAADLFGWQINGWTGSDMPTHLREFLLTRATYWEPTGLSFVLLPFGAIIGLFWGIHLHKDRKALITRLVLLAVWVIGGYLWCIAPVHWFSKAILTSHISSWLWIALGILWLLVPFFWLVRRPHPPQVRYTWMFIAIAGVLVVFQMTYWVGSQRYSTRYWYECIGGLAILSALPIAYLVRYSTLKPFVYGAFGVLLAIAHFNYSIPRVSVLYQFNNITQTYLDELYARATDDRPILVIVNGDTSGDRAVSWRSFGVFMVNSSPFLDSNIVTARVYTGNEEMRAQVLAKFPNHQVIEILGVGATFEFLDGQP